MTQNPYEQALQAMNNQLNITRSYSERWSNTVIAGMLMRSDFRCLLNALKLANWDIKWVESKGWIESKFTIVGDKKTWSAIDQWIKENE